MGCVCENSTEVWRYVCVRTYRDSRGRVKIAEAQVIDRREAGREGRELREPKQGREGSESRGSFRLTTLLPMGSRESDGMDWIRTYDMYYLSHTN